MYTNLFPPCTPAVWTQRFCGASSCPLGVHVASGCRFRPGQHRWYLPVWTRVTALDLSIMLKFLGFSYNGPSCVHIFKKIKNKVGEIQTFRLLFSFRLLSDHMQTLESLNKINRNRNVFFCISLFSQLYWKHTKLWPQSCRIRLQIDR